MAVASTAKWCKRLTAYACLCFRYRFAHNRHSPLPAERQLGAEDGSSGKSTPSWPRVEDSSDRPPSGQTTLHQRWIIKGKGDKCLEVKRGKDQWRRLLEKMNELNKTVNRMKDWKGEWLRRMAVNIQKLTFLKRMMTYYWVLRPSVLDIWMKRDYRLCF